MNTTVDMSGAAVLVTNEGNGDLTRLLPKTHIVLTGLEKVVANLEQAAVLLRLLTRSATGQDISSYVTVMSGPRTPDETEGPENFHVVLVDNGRTRLLGTEAQDVLRCIDEWERSYRLSERQKTILCTLAGKAPSPNNRSNASAPARERPECRFLMLRNDR